MIKFSLLCLIFLNVSNVISQSKSDSTIYYKPVFVNQCTGEVVDVNYTVREINEFQSFLKKTLDDFILTLPGFGSYSLITERSGEYEFEISHFGLNVDTFFIPRLFQRYVYRFEYCGDVAKGRIKDYFPNGNISFKGNFNYGSLVDSVIYYYSSGETKTRIIKNTNNTLLIYKYYKNGTLRKVYNTKSNDLTELYGNGNLKKSVYLNNKNWLIKRCYPNGAIENESNKNKEVFYYQNDQIKEQLVYNEIVHEIPIYILKKNKYFFDRFFNVVWKSFNIKGKLKRKIKFIHHPFFFNSNNIFNEIDYKSFNEIIYYKNGK